MKNTTYAPAVKIADRCSYLDATAAERLSEQYDNVIGKLVVMINNPAPWLIPNK